MEAVDREQLNKADYMNVPEAFSIRLEKPMMYYPAAAIALWHEKVEEKRREHIGGRIHILSLLQRGEYVYYVEGWVRRKKVDVRNS